MAKPTVSDVDPGRSTDAGAAADPRVDVSAPGFRGLPFRAPLYGPGPYDYTNGMVAMVNYTVTEESLLEVLPRELSPLAEPTVSMTFFIWPECTGMGPHSFSMPVIPVVYGAGTSAEMNGSWVPYLYTSTDASLACYREVQGWPAVLADVQMTFARHGDVTTVRANVTRAGRTVVAAEAQVGGRPFAEMGGPALPIILYKEIPSLDTTGTDVATYITSTSKFTRVNWQAGEGTVSFPDPGPNDPISRLLPVRYLGAIAGTLDDHYPESIRVLDPVPARN